MKKLNLALFALASNCTIVPGGGLSKATEEHPKVAGAALATATAIGGAVAAKKHLTFETRYYLIDQTTLTAKRTLVLKAPKPKESIFKREYQPGDINGCMLRRDILARIESKQKENPHTQAHIPELNVEAVNRFLADPRASNLGDLKQYFTNPDDCPDKFIQIN